MKNARKEKLLKLFLAAVILLLMSAAVVCTLLRAQKEETADATEPAVTPASVTVIDRSLKERFAENRAISEDYICQIVFDSGLLDEPVVRPYNGIHRSDGSYYVFWSDKGNYVNSFNAGTDGCDGQPCNGNDVYLRTDWKTMGYDELGSNFMDWRNHTDDRNLIIYGHHADRSYYGDYNAEQYRFTKADLLLKEENYEKNSAFALVFEDEIRRYQIAYVIVIDSSKEEELNVYRTDIGTDLWGNADPDYWDSYIRLLEKNKLYTTGVSLSRDDRLVTLSTCIQGSPAEKEIIVAKETERIRYADQR